MQPIPVIEYQIAIHTVLKHIECLTMVVDTKPLNFSPLSSLRRLTICHTQLLHKTHKAAVPSGCSSYECRCIGPALPRSIEYLEIHGSMSSLDFDFRRRHLDRDWREGGMFDYMLRLAKRGNLRYLGVLDSTTTNSLWGLVYCGGETLPQLQEVVFVQPMNWTKTVSMHRSGYDSITHKYLTPKFEEIGIRFTIEIG